MSWNCNYPSQSSISKISYFISFYFLFFENIEMSIFFFRWNMLKICFNAQICLISNVLVIHACFLYKIITTLKVRFYAKNMLVDLKYAKTSLAIFYDEWKKICHFAEIRPLVIKQISILFSNSVAFECVSL